MLTITVTLFSGQSHTFEMVPSDITVAETKIAICAGFGGTILPCKQRLIWNGKQLEDKRTLDSYPFEAPIKIHLCLRLAGGCSWVPDIGTTFPHQEKLRNICVDGSHWWNIKTPEPVIVRFHNWFPEGIHEPPAPIELYRQLIQDIRDTPLGIEEVAHRILTEYGYVRRYDGFYHLPAEHPTSVERRREKKEKEEKESINQLAALWVQPSRPAQCIVFEQFEKQVRTVEPLVWNTRFSEEH
jgi:hypothetical protein